MFLTVCLNPTLQKTLLLKELVTDTVNRSSRFYFDISGKGINVSRVLTQLDETVIHLTHLGGHFKGFFLEKTESEKMQIEYADTDAEIRFAVTVLADKDHSSTELLEEGEAVTQETESAVREKYIKLLEKVHTVILSGKNAEGYSTSVYAWMTEQAKEQHKTVICDFRGDALLAAIHFSPDIIKPNLYEFIQTFLPEFRGREEEAAKAVKEKMEELHNAFSSKIIITDGPNPVRYIDENGYGELIPQKITPTNTIGCGDAFTAGFASEFRKTADFKKAILKGEECARLNALSVRPGTIK